MTHLILSIAGKRMQNRRGAMLVFVAVAMVGLMGMLTLTLDIGAASRQRRIAQTAADAGAIAGGTQIFRDMDSASVVDAATRSILQNGFVAANATISYPPATGPHAADRRYVQVVMFKPIATIFGRIFNKDSVNVQASAVAGVEGQSNYCVYGLGTSGNAIDIPGDLTANGCGVISNGSIYVKNNISGTPEPSVAAVGTIDAGTGNMTEGIAPVPDPYAYLRVPTNTTCDFYNTVVNGTKSLTAGVYCGGITINGTANLGPGTYFILGGGLTGGSVSGTGVTIINSNGPGNNVAAFRPIVFGNACGFALTAPTTGPYKGVVVYQDPAGPSAPGANTDNEICGKGASPYDIQGAVYLPTQTFKLGNSNGKLSMKGALVAKYITGQNGGGKYTFTGATSGTGAARRLSLVQ